MMYKVLAYAALGVVAAVAACGGSGSETPATQQSATTSEIPNPHAAPGMPGMDGITRISYTCSEGKSLQLALHEGAGRADITFDGQTFELDATSSADGMVFSNGTWSFHGQGPEAVVRRDGRDVLIECRASGHP